MHSVWVEPEPNRSGIFKSQQSPKKFAIPNGSTSGIGSEKHKGIRSFFWIFSLDTLLLTNLCLLPKFEILLHLSPIVYVGGGWKKNKWFRVLGLYPMAPYNFIILRFNLSILGFGQKNSKLFILDASPLLATNWIK